MTAMHEWVQRGLPLFVEYRGRFVLPLFAILLVGLYYLLWNDKLCGLLEAAAKYQDLGSAVATFQFGAPVANSVAAIEEGARWLDACTCGLGAGSGNTPTEVLAAVLDKMGYATGVDLWKIMDVAEEVVRPLMQKPVRIGRTSLTMGYAGVYSSFLLHADRAAQQFGVDARDILVELGRLKVVGGQEDIIVEVAMGLAEKGKRKATA